MLARVRAKRPEARIEGFLVQRQAARALELRLRLGDDAMFGPWIGFGQGGTAADLAEDEAHDLPPLNLALASQLIARSRTARLMAGFRDHAPVNQAAVADVLVRLSQIAVDFPEIEALTHQPAIRRQRRRAGGRRAPGAAAGGRVRRAGHPALSGGAGRGPGRTKSGEVLTIRPVRPEDAETHGEFFHTLAPEDVRWRFFSPLKELSPTLTARLTQIDYDREIAFVASRRRPDGRDETLGRLPPDPRPGGADPCAEFAVVVSRSMKGQGLGRHMMERLFEWGRANGVREIMGHVLADNAPMLAFVKRLGFTVKRSPDEEDVMETRGLCAGLKVACDGRGRRVRRARPPRCQACRISTPPQISPIAATFWVESASPNMKWPMTATAT